MAVVRNATMPDQKIVIGQLDNIFDETTAAGMTSPCLIIVGEVVSLHEQLKWYREA